MIVTSLEMSDEPKEFLKLLRKCSVGTHDEAWSSVMALFLPIIIMYARTLLYITRKNELGK